MSNRLTGNLAGISLGGAYQGNLNGIGKNDVPEILDKQEIQVAKNRANGVYQARQSSNVDRLTGITTIPNNEPSYRNNKQPSIGKKGSDLEEFFSYQKKLDEFYQNGGFANCKRIEDLPWNKQKKNEQIFEKFLHMTLNRKREQENNNYDLRTYNNINTSYRINRSGYTDAPNLSAAYNTTVPNENSITLTTAIGAAAAYEPEEHGNMIDSWKVLADEIEASIPDKVKDMLKSEADADLAWVSNLIGAYVGDLVKFMPMPPHVRVAVNVGYFFTITVCEALMEVQMKHAQELEAIRNNPNYSEAEIKQRVQDKMIGWFLEEGGKEILNRMLDNVLERYRVPMHLRNQIKTAWSTFIVGDVWLKHWQTVVKKQIEMNTKESLPSHVSMIERIGVGEYSLT